MRLFASIHVLPLILCFWYISSYLLQPFPSCFIALVIIGVFSYTAFRNPAKGTLAAVFLTPLSLSLGYHLKAFLGESAPPYLPYAEIILISTFLGWVWRAVSNHTDSLSFSMASIERTDFEKITFWVMMLWVVLSVLGTVSSLCRTILTSPSIPFELIALKIAYAPVLGLADEFFSLTLTLRIVLAFWVVFYVQKLVYQESVQEKIIHVFVLAMATSSVYSLIQFLFEIGYSRYGNVSYSVQSTFLENESFASFSLLAFVLAFPQFFASQSVKNKVYYGLVSLLFLLSIVLSNSRAILLLLFSVSLFLLIFKIGTDFRFFLQKKREIFLLFLALPLLVAFIYFLSPYSIKKLNLLANDFLIQTKFQNPSTTTNISRQQDAFTTTGNVTLDARSKLWKSAIEMLQDSWFTGVGTGNYYRMTGFPRYQAIPIMENAHLFWLQLITELGIIGSVLVFCFFLIPLWLTFFQKDISFAHRLFSGSLLVYWLCNFVGQSLLQSELLWCFSIWIGLCFFGPISFPKALTFLKPNRLFFVLFCFLLIIHVSVSAVAVMDVGEINISMIQNESNRFNFDENGHRYKSVGSNLYEKIFVPMEYEMVEIRVSASKKAVKTHTLIIVKLLVLDENQQVITTETIQLRDGKIHSLCLTIPDNISKTMRVILTVNRLHWTGNLFKSNERELVGFHYYGYRFVESR